MQVKKAGVHMSLDVQVQQNCAESRYSKQLDCSIFTSLELQLLLLQVRDVKIRI